VHAALAATSGVETFDDVAAYLLAGADVVMTASALLRHGPEYAGVLLSDLGAWMSRRGFDSLDELRGMLAAPSETDQAGHERSVYVEAMRAANAGGGGRW
jgi:dihydroorotate dehydrogenase (fumarate)